MGLGYVIFAKFWATLVTLSLYGLYEVAFWKAGLIGLAIGIAIVLLLGLLVAHKPFRWNRQRY